MIGIAAEDVTAGYGGRPVLAGLSARLEPGELVGLVGPNGSGKSTLMKALARLLKPAGGAVRLGGEDLRRMAPRAAARRMAFLPQHPSAPPGITVRELVAHGRYPHVPPFRAFRPADHERVEAAIAACDLEALADRDPATLSGGERQRAWIAMALAQEPEALLLDEPLTSLDIGHQLELLGLLRELNDTRGMTVLVALHDLSLAARYCRRLIVMEAGRVAADGGVERILSSDVLERVFGVRMRVHAPAGDQRPLIAFDPPASAAAPPSEP